MTITQDFTTALRIRPRMSAPDLECAEAMLYDGTNADQVARWLDDPRLAYLDGEELMLLHQGSNKHLPVLDPCMVIFERWSASRAQRYVLRTSTVRMAEIVFTLEEVLTKDHRCKVFDPAPALGFIALDLDVHRPVIVQEAKAKPEVLDVESTNVSVAAEEGTPEEIFEQPSSLAEQADYLVFVDAQLLFDVAWALSDLDTGTPDEAVSQEFVPERGQQAAFGSLHQMRDFKSLMRRTI